MRIGSALAVALLSVAAWAGEGPGGEHRYELKIPAGELKEALNRVSRETGTDLVYRPEQVEGVKTGGVSGELSATEAVARLLEGTELVVRRDESGALLIAVPGKVSEGEGAGAGAGAGAGQEGATGGEEKPVLAEVVVTAQKKSERLLDVPSSVDVLNAASMEAQGMTSLVDYAKELPTLRVTSQGAGANQVSIRGIGTVGTSLISEYLDDVPFTPSSTDSPALGGGLDADMVDLNHIEVLAGPQSTLYGASAMGGLVKYVTNQPDLNSFSGSVRVDGSQVDGGGDGYGVRAVGNVPVVPGTIALRGSAFYRQDPGFVDNDYSHAKNVNSSSVKGGRLSALLKFSDSLEMTVSGVAQSIDGRSLNYVYLDQKSLQPLLGHLAYSSPIDPTFKGKNALFSDTIRWNAPVGTVTNIASYSYVYGGGDLDFSAFSFLNALAPPGTPPVNHFRFENLSDSNRLTDELRWASGPGKLEWLLAGYYTNERDVVDAANRGTDDQGVTVPSDNFFYNVLTYDFHDTYREAAAFGNITFHMTDSLETTVGMRHSWMRSSWEVTSEGLIGGGNSANSSDLSANSYLATISYKFGQHAMVYARAASGYHAGGATPVSSIERTAGFSGEFNPDRLWNYEVGVKGSSGDHRIEYSAALFHMLWDDIQVAVTEDDFLLTTNAGSAKSNGAEAMIKFIPVQGLELSADAAYADATITSNVPSINAVSGQPFPYTPKLTAATVVDYRFPLTDGLRSFVGMTYAYRGSEYTGFTGAQTLAQSGQYRLPSYSTLDLRAGVDWSRYSLIVHVNNVTNKYAVLTANPTGLVPTPVAGAVLIPRTIGISLAVHF